MCDERLLPTAMSSHWLPPCTQEETDSAPVKQEQGVKEGPQSKLDARLQVGTKVFNDIH